MPITLSVMAIVLLATILPFRGAQPRGGMWTGAFTLGHWTSPIAVTFFSGQFGGLIAACLGMAGVAAVGLLIAVMDDNRSSEDAPVAVPAYG